MLKISAEINQDDVSNLLQTYSPALVKKAIRSALDRTGTWGKNYMVDDVTRNYNLLPSRIKGSITVNRTTQTENEVAIIVKSKAQLSLLNDFGAIQDSIGILASIGTRTYRAPHAFINATHGIGPVRPAKGRRRGSYGTGGGNRFIAIRTGRRRYPMSGKPGRGPHLTTLINRLEHRDRMDRDLKDHLYQELSDQISKRTLGQSQAALIE